ncbi:hypothetical protein [Rhizobium leguminosarum]|uniref:hypothetical protein n=1 Tax=Rhizobium leguminosarum TaxID=384 RepID=UPI001FEEE69F|nr:hypothetical protein [Rhizobium leguminosarum]
MVGAFVATFPWMCLVAFFGPDEAYAGDHITYQNGMMTWWGLLETVKSLAVTAVFGFAAGGLFWLVAAAGVKDSPFLKRFQAKCSSRRSLDIIKYPPPHHKMAVRPSQDLTGKYLT